MPHRSATGECATIIGIHWQERQTRTRKFGVRAREHLDNF
jgi:hypothetical protein